jgi:hypothetical protein
MDGNKQLDHFDESFQRITLTSPHGRWDDYDITFTITMTIKQRSFEYIECKNKKDELYDVLSCCTKFLKYDPFDIELKVFATSS